jgi:tetratricopeptide (TPR) repeat protein
LTKWNERIANALRASTNSQEGPLRDALMAGRVAKFAEDYETALGHFDRALDIARTGGDPISMTGVALHRAEVLIRLRRFDDAQTFIEASRAAAPLSIRAMHIAYMDCAAGMLAQARGDLVAARNCYETALTGAKSAATSGAEGRALGHLADMYLREGNASYAAHLLRDALPKLGASSDLELSSYFVGLLGQALATSGQETEGTHLLGRALQLAEQFNYRLYERHWGMVLAGRALDEARYLDARTHYQRIWRLFDPDKPTAAFVIVCAGLSKASMSMRDYTAALTYAEQSAAAVDKLVDPPLDPPPMVMELEKIAALARGALGAALRALGRSEDAIPYLEAALASSGGNAADAGRDQIEVLRSLAAARADVREIDVAVALYKRAMLLAEKIEDPLEVAQSRRDLGLAYHKNQQDTLAIQEWSAALAIYEEKKAHAQVARLHCDIGGVRKAMAQNQRAIKDYEQALMALNSVDETDLETRGLVLSNAANAYAEQGDSESTDSFFSEAITIAERLGDRAADATRSGNYAWFLILVGRPRRAIAILERAIRISDSLGMALQAAVQTDNLGLAHDAQSEYTQAQEHHRKALDRLKTAGINSASGAYWEASIQINLANTLISLGEFDEASALLESSLAHGRGSENQDLIIRALMGQARIDILKDTPEAADAALDEAIQSARRIDARRLLADLLYLRSLQQAALKHLSAANSAWDEARKLYAMLHMPQAKIEPTWLEGSG